MTDASFRRSRRIADRHTRQGQGRPRRAAARRRLRRRRVRGRHGSPFAGAGGLARRRLAPRPWRSARAYGAGDRRADARGLLLRIRSLERHRRRTISAHPPTGGRRPRTTALTQKPSLAAGASHPATHRRRSAREWPRPPFAPPPASPARNRAETGSSTDRPQTANKGAI